METAPLRSYRLEFAKRAEWRREDERRLDQIKQKEEKDKKEEREQVADQEALLDTMMGVMATEMELASFEVENDLYKSTTVEALMENEEQLQAVNEELRIMLDKAYVLPDGRRVFKTEDGTRVFDEHGMEVKEIDPRQIEDWRPYAERYGDAYERRFALTEEREELHEFQKLTDDIDAEIAEAKENGGMTRERLQELRRMRDEEAPDVVKAKMGRNGPEQEAEAAAAAQKPETASRPAARLDAPAF